MDCPRCGMEMEGGVCPNCGFPILQVKPANPYKRIVIRSEKQQ